jgi:hypothetical protein
MAGDRSAWNGSALGGRSRWADVDGPVHYLDFGGPARGPVIVCGIKVTVLTPGPEDLAVMGVNPMDPRRREAVLDASLRTSPASLGRPYVLT